MRRMREDHLHRNYSDVNERPIRCRAKLIQPKAGMAACLAMIPSAYNGTSCPATAASNGGSSERSSEGLDSRWALPGAGSFNRPTVREVVSNRTEQKNFKKLMRAAPYPGNMTKDDTVIITGDCGGVWFGDSRDDETLDWLERLPFTLVFVCGNHENYDALERCPVAEWHGGKVHRIRPHVLHLMRGQIFELEGCRFFTMGGAKSHDIEDGILEPDAPDFERRLMMLQRKPRARYRINHISWWAQELPSDEEYAEARRSLDAVGWQVDYIITHCAPTSIALMGTRHNEADRLTDFLQEVRERAKYHYWLFGHYHDNKAIDEKHILLWEQIVRII